jgi:hypothetical protein
MSTPAQARKKRANRLRKREQIVDGLLSTKDREVGLAALALYYEREYFAREILPFLSLDVREFEARLKSASARGRERAQRTPSRDECSSVTDK